MFYRPDLTKMGLQWYLTDKCNYHCPYCFDQKKDLPPVPYTLEESTAALDWLQGLYGPLQVNFTGGEPTLSPLFFPLAEHLSARGNVLFVVTNLSRSAGKFEAAIANPDLCWINASYHRSDMELLPFAARVRQLQEAGFHVSASQVLYPPWLAEALTNREYFRQYLPDIFFGLNVFFGEYQGRPYPESYTAEERTQLAAAGVDLEGRLQETVVRDHQFCRAGKDFFVIAPTGIVKRCTSFAPLREERFPQFSLFDRAFPCPLTECLCPDMYEFREARHL